MTTKRKDVLHLIVMSWLVFTTLVMPQLVLTRCLIQPTYRWSNTGFSGTGMGGGLLVRHRNFLIRRHHDVVRLAGSVHAVSCASHPLDQHFNG